VNWAEMSYSYVVPDEIVLTLNELSSSKDVT